MTDKAKIIRECIEHLNRVTGSRFRPASDNATNHIGARLEQGHTLADLKLVIDHKATEWLGKDPWQSYLRPRTLFGSKFDGYLEAARRHASKLAAEAAAKAARRARYAGIDE